MVSLRRLEVFDQKMNDERPLWDTLPQEEYEEWLDKEECEHGIHRDSGHTCWECLVNDGDAEIGESDGSP